MPLNDRSKRFCSSSAAKGQRKGSAAKHREKALLLKDRRKAMPLKDGRKTLKDRKKGRDRNITEIVLCR
jgi:hypothetical protein